MDPIMRARFADALYGRNPYQGYAQGAFNADRASRAIDAYESSLEPDYDLNEVLDRAKADTYGQMMRDLATPAGLSMIPGVKQTADALYEFGQDYDPTKAPLSQFARKLGDSGALSMAAQYAPGGSLADYWFGAGGDYKPFAENLKEGRYGDAAGQLWGAAGDLASFTPAGMLGAVLVGVGSDAAKAFMDFARENPDKSVDDLWREFQMAQDPAGNVFREIPDRDPVNLDLTDLMARAQERGGPVTLPDLWPRGDDLYDLYPALRDVDVSFFRDDPMMHGGTTADGKSLQFNVNSAADPAVTVAHEVNHVLQGLEGWPRGGNPGMFDTLSPRHRPEDVQLALSRGVADPFEAYQDLWGETASRLVGSRKEAFDAGAENVYDTNPLMFLDRAPGDVMVRQSEISGNELLPQFRDFWGWGPEDFPEAMIKRNQAALEGSQMSMSRDPLAELDAAIKALNEGPKPEDAYIKEANDILKSSAGPRLAGGTDMTDPEVARLAKEMEQGNRDIQAQAQKLNPTTAENDNIGIDPETRARILENQKKILNTRIYNDEGWPLDWSKEQIDTEKAKRAEIDASREEGILNQALLGEQIMERERRMETEVLPAYKDSLRGVIPDDIIDSYNDVDALERAVEMWKNQAGDRRWAMEQVRQRDAMVKGLTDGLSDDDLANLSIRTYHGTPSEGPITRFDSSRFGRNDGNTEGWGVYSGENPKVAMHYRNAREDLGGKGGRVYALDLPGNPEDYIDRDVLFSQQPREVQDAVKAMINVEPSAHTDVWHRALETRLGPEETARYLAEKTGKRGFRYLDAGSRNVIDTTPYRERLADAERALKADPDNPQLKSEMISARYNLAAAERQSALPNTGTHNYVSFNPDEIEIRGSTDRDVSELIRQLDSGDMAQMSMAIDNLNTRMKGLGSTKVTKTAGDERYVGAPDGVNSPEAEEALIERVMDFAKRGVGGKDFYSDYQNTIRANTNDPVYARELAMMTGHTSPQTTPVQNHNEAVKGMNQKTVGAKVEPGRFKNAMGERVRADLEKGRLPSDPKTGQFTYNILPEELRPKDFGDYADLPPPRAVHDTWDLRAFGYSAAGEGGKGASIPQHKYMDKVYDEVIRRLNADPETRALAGPEGWNVENAQAAVWDAARGSRDMFEVPSIGEVFDAAKGFTQMAAIPGPSTGVDPRLLEAPLKEKRAYTNRMFDAISDESGASVIARSLGLSRPMEEGFGPWQGMMEPNRKIDIGVAGVGSGKTRDIEPSSDLVARTMRRWHQIALGQEGSGLTFPYATPSNQPGIAQSPLAVVDAPLSTAQDYDHAFTVAKGVWGDDFADKVVIQPSDRGLMVKSITGDNPTFQKEMQEFAKRLGSGAPRRMQDVGNQFDYVQWNDPSYRGLLDETRSNPNLKAIFDEKVIPALSRVQAESDAWAREMGIDANTVPDRLRRIITAAGSNWPKAIDAAVKKGLIPVAAGLVVLDQLTEEPSSGVQ